MGNYTLRTDVQEDSMIKEAQEYMQVSTVSKALLTAISHYKANQETIFRLQRELEQERQRIRHMSRGISDFEESMTRLFALK